VTGRPSDYTPELAALICSRVAENERGLTGVCEADDMPHRSTVYAWLSLHKSFSDSYARACEARAFQMADDILKIADDGSNDTYVDGDGNEHVNADVIQRSRLRVDTRKWLMARLLPKKFGERVEQVHTGDPDNPVQSITRVERVIIREKPEGQAA
jgi:hypothetical protein